MKNPSKSFSTIRALRLLRAFTLTETIIAIGVLTVLLTGFIAVFTPAAQGIRRSISSEQADRLTTTLEIELATLRKGQETPDPATGFDKAFDWIQKGNTATKAIFVYQYRGDITLPPRADGTPEPKPSITGEPGKDYVVQSMSRRLGDAALVNDLKAIEGSVFFVKPTQLTYKPDPDDASIPPRIILGLGTAGQIVSADGTVATDAATYKEAVIAFSAEFHSVPTKTIAYLQSGAFTTRFTNAKKPIFTRNLAVRR